MNHRLALFTPVSPVRSALVDHIEGLLPRLACRYDVTIVTNGTYSPAPPLAADGNPIPWITFDRFEQEPDAYDLVVYELGDEANIHGYMFDALHRYPGLVLLHDLVLHHAIVELTLNRGSVEEYLAEMRYAAGKAGEAAARRVIRGEGSEGIYTTFPLFERVLDDSLAVIGMNAYMRSEMLAKRPDARVYQSACPYYMPCDVLPKGEQEETEAHHDPVIATFGLANSQKRLELALDAFAAIARLHPRVTYRLIGAPRNDTMLNNQIAARGLTGRVLPSGWLDRTEFCRAMATIDLALQLRYPHVGGTPYSPIRLMGLGVPTIISDIEPLAEVPEDAVVRVRPNAPGEVEQVVAAVDYLLTHPQAATEMGARAMRWVHEHHNLDTILEQTSNLIDDLIARENKPHAVRSRLVHRSSADVSPEDAGTLQLVRVMGAALSELGVASSDTSLYRSAAEAIAGLTGPPDKQVN